MSEGALGGDTNVIDVADLVGAHGQHRVVHLDVDVEVELASSRTVGPVHLDIRIEGVDAGVDATATGEVAWASMCRRCLEPVGGSMLSTASAMYRIPVESGPATAWSPRPGALWSAGAAGASTSASEIDAGDVETIHVGGGGAEIDLHGLIIDVALAALPDAPLCSGDCRGPAPTDFPVGFANDARAVDERWRVLDSLRTDD